MRKPTRRRNQQPEHKLQVAVLDYLTLCGRREFKWFAIPSGGLRHINVALALKAEGVVAGVPDLCIMMDQGRTAWLELKDKRGRLSNDQVGFSAICERLGHLWGVAYTIDEAIALFVVWGVLRPGVRVAA